jgi:hypothetical protein
VGRGGRPDLHAAGVGGKDGAADMVRSDKIGDAAFDHCNRLPVQPDIFADQRARGLVVFRDPAALGIEHRMDRDAGRGNRPDRLPPGEVILVRTLQYAVDRHGGHATGGVISVGIAGTATVGQHIARTAIGIGARAASGEVDARKPVGGGRVDMRGASIVVLGGRAVCIMGSLATAAIN